MSRRQRQNSNQPKNMNNMHHYDPFGMGPDNFGFGIKDDFDDPFENMMGGFGFPNLGQIHQRIFGNLERAFGGMGGLLGDGNNRQNNRDNQNQGGLQRAKTNNFQGFFSMQGVGPGTVISKSYCSRCW